MIVTSRNVPDATHVLRWTTHKGVDVYVASKETSPAAKVAMLTQIASKMGISVAIQHFPDISKEP